MATVKTSSSSKSSADQTSKALAKTLSSVSAQAKSLGINTDKADAMVKQTNRQGSKSFSGSNEEKAYNANIVTAASMAPAATIKIPTPTVPTGTPDVTALNAALSNPTTGLKAESSGGFTVDQITQDAMTSGQDRFTKMIAELNNTKQPSAVDIQKELDKKTGIDNLKQQEAEYTGQIDSIVKNSQAQSLALEGQGRGQTTQFLGGEQARIQREAAVAALPVQAQLAAVQGKIQVANDYINKWGSLLIQDATNKYNQKVKTIEAVYNFGTAQDKLKFDNLTAQAKEKKDKEVALASAKTKAISQALAQPGGASVVSAIQLATDENGVVAALGKYNGDVLAQQVQQEQLKALRTPKVTKRDTQVVGNQLIDTQTGEVISTVDTGINTINGKPATEGQLKVNGYADRLTQANRVLTELDSNFTGKFAIGGSLPNILQTADRQAYEQAKRNFVTAVLRSESGASISPTEFSTAEKQYFAQPGDQPFNLLQKQAARNTVINNFYREANVARPVSAGDIIESDGKKYKVDIDGITLKEI